MISDEIYETLSQEAYNDLKEGEVITFKVGPDIETWKVEDTLQIDSNGLDAAVFKKGEEVVIAYRGTEGGALTEAPSRFLKDIGADAWNIVFKVKPGILNDQFKSANGYTKEIKEKYPNAEISTTGHSLGGALASYSAAMHDLSGVTWNGPAVTDLLPKDVKKKVESGYFDDKVINYVHPQDSIGSGALEEYEKHIGTTYYIDNNFELANVDNEGAPFKRLLDSVKSDGYHFTSWFSFDDYGNLNNPILFNMDTNEWYWKSPRYSSSQSIVLRPTDITKAASSLRERVSELADTHRVARNDIFKHSHMAEYQYIEDGIEEAFHEFFMWYAQKTEEVADKMDLTASTMNKADTLA